MKNKLVSTLIAAVMLFVSVPFLTPQKADAWFGNTTVYMFHRQSLGTVWVGNTSYLAWDVGFAKDSAHKFEVWSTRGYTLDNEFGSNKLIQNMVYYANVSLSTSILNDSNKFSYGCTNK